MFLLVTGASGVGKSTVRTRLRGRLPPSVEAIELAALGEAPQWTLEWRQRMVERLVQRARTLEGERRHLLVCGDPIPPGEVAAAPSAEVLALSVLLLDASPAAQRARLAARGDPPTYLEHHVAFADWMRHHVFDPAWRPDVIIQGGWSAMRWDRWRPSRDASVGPAPWRADVLDTSALDPDTASREVAAWVGRELAAANGSPAA